MPCPRNSLRAAIDWVELKVMKIRSIMCLLVTVAMTHAASAQLSQTRRFEILGTVIADSAISKIVMPFGDNGVTLSSTGEIDLQALQKEINQEGPSIELDEVVEITRIEFHDDRIEIELNDGGKNKKSILERIEVGFGGRTAPVADQQKEPAKGARVVLRFEDKVPVDMTPDDLRAYLAPVLDFEKRNFMDTGIESLPEEFQEAVRAQEAKIGMDKSTVLLAMGRPDRRVRETVDGRPREDWIYFKTGLGADFITFEDDIVIAIKRY